jgi:hypothetical protein
MWKMMDDPTSSTSALLVMTVIMFLILFSTCTFLIETMPQFYEHNPDKYNSWCVHGHGWTRPREQPPPFLSQLFRSTLRTSSHCMFRGRFAIRREK